MIQATTEPSTVLDSIVSAIVNQVAPRRIVLFGSRARGDECITSDYDLMVEIDEGDDLRSTRDAIWSAMSARRWPADVIVRTPRRFVEMRDDPGYIDWDISRQGRVLYQRGPLDSLRSGVMQVSEPKDGWASMGTWLQRAEDDFRVMENCLASNPPIWSGVALHAHEGTEKLLKALIIRRGVHPDWIHSLRALMTSLEPEIATDKRVQRSCDLLDALYPRSRYPGEEEDLPITETEARDAADAARFARAMLLPRIVRKP